MLILLVEKLANGILFYYTIQEQGLLFEEMGFIDHMTNNRKVRVQYFGVPTPT